MTAHLNIVGRRGHGLAKRDESIPKHERLGVPLVLSSDSLSPPKTLKAREAGEPLLTSFTFDNPKSAFFLGLHVALHIPQTFFPNKLPFRHSRACRRQSDDPTESVR